jgi:4-aminobutyrate aminotransferase-like enzyme
MSAPVSEHLIGPDLRTQAPVFVRGEGVELIDGDGRRYLDAASGVGVTCIGYSASEVVAAVPARDAVRGTARAAARRPGGQRPARRS